MDLDEREMWQNLNKANEIKTDLIYYVLKHFF